MLYFFAFERLYVCLRVCDSSPTVCISCVTILYVLALEHLFVCSHVCYLCPAVSCSFLSCCLQLAVLFSVGFYLFVDFTLELMLGVLESSNCHPMI